MRFYACDLMFEDACFTLTRLRGDLRFHRSKEPRSRDLPPRVIDILRLCDDPYQLEPDSTHRRPAHPPSDPRTAGRALRRMLRLRIAGFLALTLYASRRSPVFPNSQSAMAWFNAQVPESDRSRLCLPRAMFAAKTSDAFKDGGAVVIGVMLPTRSLHAWIIENRHQPDDTDRAWVCYRPIAVLL